MMVRMPTAAACVFCCLMAATAYAQTTPVSAAPPPPANLAFVDGAVNVVHDSVVEPANPPVILLEGDGVRATSGRAEIVFADGTLLHLDRSTDLEILSPDRVRLLNGSAIARVSAAAAHAYFIDTPLASVRLDGRGEYTVSAINHAANALEVSVARGSAEIDDGGQRLVVRGGESVSLAAAGARAIFRTFNTARWDGFAQWSNERANGFATSQSAAQLPAELRPYSEDFDEYGRWDYVAPYGSVWFPSVAVGWRPYYDGSWGYTRYGWTWYGRNRWAWPTHHFGRWGYNGGWFWIPTNVWGPAWVGWGFSAGHVSWSPLGFDGLPTIGFWPRRDQSGPMPHRPGLGWTVVPRSQFGPRLPIRASAVDGDRLDDLSRRALVFGGNAPPGPRGARPYVGAARTFSTVAPRVPARVDAPTYDRSGPVRRPANQPASGAPANFTVPRSRVDPVTRPPQVEYIRGSSRAVAPIGTPPPAIPPALNGSGRPVSGSDAANRPSVMPRPDRDATDSDRRGPYSAGYRAGYERRGASDADRGRDDGARGGSVRSGNGDRAGENGAGAREGGGGGQRGGASAGAPAPGGRGPGGSAGGERGGGGRSGGGGRGGAVGRPR